MPQDRRTLRDIYQAYENMKQYQLRAGQWVQWFRYNTSASTVMPIYDTGPQRVWYPAITLPVLMGQYVRAAQNFDDDGLYLVNTAHFVISYDAFFHSNMPDPDTSGNDHLNDRLAFDGVLFSVDSFLPRGRVASNFLTISVDAREVAQSEMDEDVTSAMFTPYIVVPDSGTN